MTYYICKLRFPLETTYYVCHSEKGAWALAESSGANISEVFEVTGLKQRFKDDWIPWAGGECPCPNDKVKIRFQGEERNTAELHPACLSSALRWDHQNSGGDIIEYKVIRSE